MWYGIAAYSLWGLLTLYWRLFPNVAAMQVLGHRIVWSFVVLAAIIAASWLERRTVLQSVTRPVIGLYALAAVLIGVNWLEQPGLLHHAPGQCADGSGRVSRTPATPAMGRGGICVFGCVWLTLAYGTLPWIGLALAASFGSYGLVKKKAPLPSPSSSSGSSRSRSRSRALSSAASGSCG